MDSLCEAFFRLSDSGCIIKAGSPLVTQIHNNVRNLNAEEFTIGKLLRSCLTQEVVLKSKLPNYFIYDLLKELEKFDYQVSVFITERFLDVSVLNNTVHMYMHYLYLKLHQ